MNKKKVIISEILLLILLAVSLVFFLKTENSIVTAFSLLGITASGLCLIVFSLFILSRQQLSMKQELVVCNCFLIFIPLIPISYIIWAVLTGKEDTLSELASSTIWIFPSLGMLVYKRREIKKELSKLNE